MPMLVQKQQKKALKRSKLRYLEYYGMQEIFNELYAKSKDNKIFTNLMEIIASEENIKLAYRNIKKNAGSETSGVDELTIKDIKKLSNSEYVEKARKKMSWYKPKAVRRVEIPKPNGKLRPLGIPTIWDRMVQQCILQVLKPICEAKFSKHSYGFRPVKSAKNAMTATYFRIQLSNLHFVVDIDIKNFFDEVNHTKLIKQMWELGIRDKKLICIMKEMLKAPIVMPDGKTVFPTKGTPQGGVLSPLLANIVLNELDWWVTSQWEEKHKHMRKPPKHQYSRNGERHLGYEYKLLRKSNLKEMYIVRYADDFKIFCRKRSDANKIFIAVKQWLKERLKLEVSEEKSKVVNLKRNYSEFLGIKIKAIPKRKKHVVKSKMCDKAIKKVKHDLTEQIKKIQRPKDCKDEWKSINQYNLMVMGIHNYYEIATNVNLDLHKIAKDVKTVIKNRLKNRVKREGSLEKYKYIKGKYGKSKQMRFVSGVPLVPLAYIRTKPPMPQKAKANCYTVEGRAEIHTPLNVNMKTLRILVQNQDTHRSIEYMDNRISLYAGQNGQCAITGKTLEIDEIHCHHKKPIMDGGTDEYRNLLIIHKDVHQLIHAKDKETIEKYMHLVKPNESQLVKINKYRKLAKTHVI